MIELQKLTPTVYYNHSRDFQFIGRLYDLALNSVKTNTDLLYSLPFSSQVDDKILDLLSLTFGFKSRHNYNVQQLKSLCACFAKVIRNKGNITAIRDACTALVRAEGITSNIMVINSEATCSITIYVPYSLSDTNLLKDLLTYILPAGMCCNIIKATTTTKTAETKSTIASTATISKRLESGTSQVVKSLSGTAIIDNKPSNEIGAIMNATISKSSIS